MGCVREHVNRLHGINPIVDIEILQVSGLGSRVA